MEQDSLTGSEEIAVVIGINKCSSGATCSSPEESMGTVLYNGPFDPQFHETYLPPYQNFTLEIPEGLATENGIVTVAHFSLVGVSKIALSVSKMHTNIILLTIGKHLSLCRIPQPDCYHCSKQLEPAKL